MGIKIDEEACTGCGLCESVCPDVFQLGEDEKAHVLDPESTLECVDEAIENCPVEAIKKE